MGEVGRTVSDQWFRLTCSVAGARNGAGGISCLRLAMGESSRSPIVRPPRGVVYYSNPSRTEGRAFSEVVS